MPMPCDIGKGNAKARQCKGNGLAIEGERSREDVENVREQGHLRLLAYLAADPNARERFDRRQAREILADCDAEWRALNEIADDPIHRRVAFERWLVERDR